MTKTGLVSCFLVEHVCSLTYVVSFIPYARSAQVSKQTLSRKHELAQLLLMLAQQRSRTKVDPQGLFQGTSSSPYSLAASVLIIASCWWAVSTGGRGYVWSQGLRSTMLCLAASRDTDVLAAAFVSTYTSTDLYGTGAELSTCPPPTVVAPDPSGSQLRDAAAKRFKEEDAARCFVLRNFLVSKEYAEDVARHCSADPRSLCCETSTRWWHWTTWIQRYNVPAAVALIEYDGVRRNVGPRQRRRNFGKDRMGDYREYEQARRLARRVWIKWRRVLLRTSLPAEGEPVARDPAIEPRLAQDVYHTVCIGTAWSLATLIDCQVADAAVQVGGERARTCGQNMPAD